MTTLLYTTTLTFGIVLIAGCKDEPAPRSAPAAKAPPAAKATASAKAPPPADDRAPSATDTPFDCAAILTVAEVADACGHPVELEVHQFETGKGPMTCVRGFRAPAGGDRFAEVRFKVGRYGSTASTLQSEDPGTYEDEPPADYRTHEIGDRAWSYSSQWPGATSTTLVASAVTNSVYVGLESEVPGGRERKPGCTAEGLLALVKTAHGRLP